LGEKLENRYEYVDRVPLYTTFDGGKRWEYLVE
jgi:hypothetical protein